MPGVRLDRPRQRLLCFRGLPLRQIDICQTIQRVCMGRLEFQRMEKGVGGVAGPARLEQNNSEQVVRFGGGWIEVQGLARRLFGGFQVALPQQKGAVLQVMLDGVGLCGG